MGEEIIGVRSEKIQREHTVIGCPRVGNDGGRQVCAVGEEAHYQFTHGRGNLQLYQLSSQAARDDCVESKAKIQEQDSNAILLVQVTCSNTAICCIIKYYKAVVLKICRP